MGKSFSMQTLRRLGGLSCPDRIARVRAYKRLRSTCGEKPIFDFINNLVETAMPLPDDFFKGIVPAGYEASTITAFRQKLLRVTIDNDLSVGVMLMIAESPTKFKARLPVAWRTALRREGMQIHGLSPLLWAGLLVQRAKEALRCWRDLGHRPVANEMPAPYGLLMGLPPRAYAGMGAEDYGVFSNFAHWFRERNPALDIHVVAGGAAEALRKPFFRIKADMWPGLPNGAAQRHFNRCARHVAVRCLLEMLRGRWQYLFMARDILELHYMALVGDDMLPRRVALTNSHYINRPLWSYDLEKRGIETGIYFYSTNIFNVKLTNGDYGQIYGYNLMSWTHYYVATAEQADFIKSVTSYPKQVNVVGPIPLEDNGRPLPQKTGKVVAYFDVQPFRDAFMAEIGRPSQLYFYEASRRNLEDILVVCKAHGYFLALKPKRDVGNRICPRYRRMIDDMAARGDIILIDSYIAAERVADWADIVISQPFTSVAFVAHGLGRPSVYYDAMGIYKPEQPAAQGRPVIQDAETLSSWLRQQAAGGNNITIRQGA